MLKRKKYASSTPVLLIGLNGTKWVHKEERKVSMLCLLGVHLIVNQKYVRAWIYLESLYYFGPLTLYVYYSYVNLRRKVQSLQSPKMSESSAVVPPTIADLAPKCHKK